MPRARSRPSSSCTVTERLSGELGAGECLALDADTQGSIVGASAR